MDYISLPGWNNVEIIYKYVSCFEYCPQAAGTQTELVQCKFGRSNSIRRWKARHSSSFDSTRLDWTQSIRTNRTRRG